MAGLNGSESIPNWNDEAKTAFNDFKKRKRSLPSPSPPDSSRSNDSIKKNKRIDFRNFRLNTQLDNRRDLFEKNRGSSIDFNSTKDEGTIKNSTFSEHMSIDNDCDSELDRTEVLCDEMEKNIALVHEMIKNKGDTYDILGKLTNDFTDFYKKSREMFQKINSDHNGRINRLNNQIVTLENNIYDKINSVCEQNEERLNAIEISQKCAKENNFLWISFTDPKEVESLRQKNKFELIREAKSIFSRMDIWLNSVNRQIIDVVIQKVAVRVDNGYKNEIVLGVRFINNVTVQEISRLIMNYAKNQFVAKNYDAVRYTVRDNWSPMIWKILRVCYDLSNFKLIEKAYVGESGIVVHYKSLLTQENGSTSDFITKSLIRNESDLDKLRQNISDVGCELPTFRIYNSTYFKLNPMERKSFKDNLKVNLASSKPDPPTTTVAPTETNLNAENST